MVVVKPETLVDYTVFYLSLGYHALSHYGTLLLGDHLALFLSIPSHHHITVRQDFSPTGSAPLVY